MATIRRHRLAEHQHHRGALHAFRVKLDVTYDEIDHCRIANVQPVLTVFNTSFGWSELFRTAAQVVPSVKARPDCLASTGLVDHMDQVRCYAETTMALSGGVPLWTPWTGWKIVGGEITRVTVTVALIVDAAGNVQKEVFEGGQPVYPPPGP